MSALAGLSWLCWSWIHVYRREQVSLVWDVAEGLAVFAVGMVALDPLAALGVVYNGLIFRSLYGRSGRVAGIAAIRIYRQERFGGGPDTSGRSASREGGIRLSDREPGRHSSLSYLSRFPFDYLKIDRSFVMGLGERRENEPIILGTVMLAHAPSMKAIAKGAETIEQVQILQGFDCDLVQGYYFSKALSSEEMNDCLSKTNRKLLYRV